MIFMYSPERRPGSLELSRFGDTVIVNGAPLDLSVVPDGCILPRGSIDCIYINGAVERQNGIISVPWSVPIPADANEEAAFLPIGVSIQEDGPVQIPGLPAPEGLPPTEPAIVVDLSQLITPATLLAEAREAAYLPRKEFARLLAMGEVIPFSEATAFATGMALPSKAQAYIDNEVPEVDRDMAVFIILTSDNVHRNDPHVLALAQQEDLSPEVMDKLFGIA